MLLQIVGLVLASVVARDLLHELFHPGGAGTLSRWIRRLTWRAFHLYARGEGRRLRMAGPVALASVVAVWAGLAVVGWALFILPYLPEAFRYSSPLVPTVNADLGTALYISLVSLSTLGFGDITPTMFVPRVALNAEAFLGFMLLTAGISWTLSIRPVLTERRACTLLVRHLRELERDGLTLERRSSDEVRPVLHSLTVQLGRIRAHLMQSPETYYFRSPDERVVLASSLPWLHRSAGRLAADANGSLRDSARILSHAIDDLCSVIGTEFLQRDGASTEDALARYAADHLVIPE